MHACLIELLYLGSKEKTHVYMLHEIKAKQVLMQLLLLFLFKLSFGRTGYLKKHLNSTRSMMSLNCLNHKVPGLS